MTHPSARGRTRHLRARGRGGIVTGTTVTHHPIEMLRPTAMVRLNVILPAAVTTVLLAAIAAARGDLASATSPRLQPLRLCPGS